MNETTEQSRVRAVERGFLARQLLEHPLWQEIVVSLRSAWTEQMLMTAPDQRDEREDFYRMITALGAVEASVSSIELAGQQAAEDREPFEAA